MTVGVTEEGAAGKSPNVHQIAPRIYFSSGLFQISSLPGLIYRFFHSFDNYIFRILSFLAFEVFLIYKTLPTFGVYVVTSSDIPGACDTVKALNVSVHHL